MNEDPYMMLAKVILPSEMTEYFELVKVRTDEYAQEARLHLYLDEKDITPEGHTDMIPNGFYEESCMNDFPIREYRTVLHVRRRRWKDAECVALYILMICRQRAWPVLSQRCSVGVP